MAAYAASVTSLMRRAVKTDNVQGIGLYAGSVNVSNYNTTLAEITAISGKFRDIISVSSVVTDEGFVLKWNSASKSFEAYGFDYDSTVDGGMAELADDTDAGAGDFIAIGTV